MSDVFFKIKKVEIKPKRPITGKYCTNCHDLIDEAKEFVRVLRTKIHFCHNCATFCYKGKLEQ